MFRTKLLDRQNDLDKKFLDAYDLYIPNFLKGRVFISGGFALSRFSGLEYNDIDIYFRESYDYLDIQTLDFLYYKNCYHGDFSYTYFTSLGKLQFLYDTGTPYEIMEKYDFENCKVAFDNTHLYYSTKNPIFNEKNARVIKTDYNNVHYETLLRIKKYQQKGYFFDEMQTKKCIEIVLMQEKKGSFYNEIDLIFSLLNNMRLCSGNINYSIYPIGEK